MNLARLLQCSLTPTANDSVAVRCAVRFLCAERKDHLAAVHLGLFLWALDTPPPAVILLVSNENSFSAALHGLRFRGFTVLLASTEPLANTLEAAATETFSWNAMLPPSQPAAHAPSPPGAMWSPQQRRRELESPRQLVLYTLETLKDDKLMPSDFNVAARLKYVINKHGLKDCYKENTPPSSYLTASITAGDIRPCFEDDKRIYLPRGIDLCWPYVDPAFPINVYSTDAWRSLQGYLLTQSGREKIEASKSR